MNKTNASPVIKTGIVISLFLSFGLVGGCAGVHAGQTTTTQQIEPDGLNIMTSGLPGIFSLDLLLSPVDENGNPLTLEGDYSITIWQIDDIFSRNKESVLQEWGPLSVTLSDYDQYGQVYFSLPYEDFEPGWAQSAIVQVSFDYNGSQTRAEKLALLRKSPDC